MVTPGDPGYDHARAVWNGAIDRRPRWIARCTSPADVAAMVRFGRERKVAISVRGGGHGVAGTALCDDGVVIDLGPMKRITVDPAARTATVGAGVRWGELDATTQAFGLATTGGTMSRTGVSGLTLGGGIGWLMRRHGLTVDNLLAVELVTADGRTISASDDEEPDLFWGLRGGGAGLGVVTSFTFRLHPVGPDVLSGLVLWSLEDGPGVLRAYRDFVAAAPPEVATAAALRQAPPAPFLPVELHSRPICAVGMAAFGELHQAERLLTPMRSFGRPLLDLVKVRPYTNLQSMLDAGNPDGWHYYWKSTGLRQLDRDTIDTMVDHASRARSPWSYAVLFHLGGAGPRSTPTPPRTHAATSRTS
ncbi:MAG: FAD-binding oxidoreductase [Acidimicrobiales bacterium]